MIDPFGMTCCLYSGEVRAQLNNWHSEWVGQNQRVMRRLSWTVGAQNASERA
jgi:hypothetical protein